MTFLFTLSWVLLEAAACLAVRACRLDAELRRRSPTLVFRRRDDRLAAGRHPWLGFFEPEPLFPPPHWRRHRYGERGTALVDRLYRCVAGAAVLAVLGLSLLKSLLPAG